MYISPTSRIVGMDARRGKEIKKFLKEIIVFTDEFSKIAH
jgi:hypothetical protein